MLGENGKKKVFNELCPTDMATYLRFTSNPFVLFSRLDPQNSLIPVSVVIFNFSIDWLCDTEEVSLSSLSATK